MRMRRVLSNRFKTGTMPTRYPIAIEPGDDKHAFGIVVPDLILSSKNVRHSCGPIQLPENGK